MPAADTMQQIAVGVGHHVGIEIHIHFGSTQHDHIHHTGKVSFAVIVVACERACVDMTGIFAHGTHAFKVECLSVEDIIHQAFLQHLHRIFIASGTDKPCFPAAFFQDITKINPDGKRRTACTCLIGKAVMNDAGFIAKLCGHLGNEQPVGTFGDLCGSRENLFRNPHLIHFNHIIHIVAVDLPWDTRERHQIVGNNNNLVGILRIGQGKAQQTTCSGPSVAGCIAKRVGRGCSNHSDVDLHFAVLNGLIPSAVRAQYAKPFHFAFGSKFTQRTVHAAFDMMDGTVFKILDQMFVTRKRGRWIPAKIFHSQFFGNIKNLIGDDVAVSEMMVCGNGHTIAQTCFDQSFFQCGDRFVAVEGIIGTTRYARRKFPPLRFVFSHSLIRNMLLTVNDSGNHSPRSIFYQFIVFFHFLNFNH